MERFFILLKKKLELMYLFTIFSTVRYPSGLREMVATLKIVGSNPTRTSFKSLCSSIGRASDLYSEGYRLESGQRLKNK